MSQVVDQSDESFSEDSFDPKDLHENDEAKIAHQSCIEVFFEGEASRAAFKSAKKVGQRIKFIWKNTFHLHDMKTI